MASSPLILAALAKAALPSYQFKSVATLPSNGTGPIDSVLLTDTEGVQYVIRESKNGSGNLKLAGDNQAAKLAKSSGHLPFKIPTLIGETRNQRGNTVQVLEFIYGSAVDLHSLSASDELVPPLGRAIASIHNLSADRLRQAGAPEFNSNQIRDARLAELDKAAATGMVPASLLQRWENALEDLDLFRFKESVIHGNLVSENILELNGEVSGVLGWSSLRIGDPAEDLVPYAASGNNELLDAVKFAYFENRSDTDANLAQRATLYAELDIARYLVQMLAEGNQAEAEWAVSELEVTAGLVSSGDARLLSTNGFVALAPLVVPDTHTIVTENIPEIAPEIVEGSDLATRPIDLPESSDDQLF
jgi:aminoglycoside phosphotransferase (APT) family kinase protein